jgi:hypothetical protein
MSKSKPTPTAAPKPDKAAIKEARIRHIMLLITTGRWVTHVTAEALSKPPTDPEAPGWGLSIDYIEKLAAEAARRLRDRLQNDDLTRMATVSTLEFIRAQCMEDRDWKHAIAATQAINGIVAKGGLGMGDAGQGAAGPQVININNILPLDRIRAAEANAAAVGAPKAEEKPAEGGEPQKAGGGGGAAV